MSNGFLPTSDAALLAWSANFSSLIGIDYAALGLVESDATGYASKHADFASALATATAPNTRTKPAIIEKNQTRAVLRDAAYALSKKIQGAGLASDAQKAALGIDVKDAPSPIPAPSDPPAIEVAEMNGWVAKIRLRPLGSEGRAKLPDNVIGANIFSYVGAAPPADPSEYDFEGETSKAFVEIAFANTLPAGTRVWVCAAWKSPRLQTGPACAPVGLVLGGGVPEVTVA